MITNYLKELLNDNECVIIPEFGAFISKRHSATIDYANHRFLPPYKEIVFNDKLKNDDGILADFISKKENISKEEASNKIHEFVNQSVAILDVNSELELVDLGKFININGNFIFNAKDDVNILGDSFGLTEFNYQPVFRTETYQVIKEKIVVEQKEKNTDYTIAVESVEELTSTTTRRRPSLFRTVAVTTLAFLLVFVINWTTEKTDSNGNVYIDRTNGADGVATMMIKKGMDLKELQSIIGKTDYSYSSKDGTKVDIRDHSRVLEIDPVTLNVVVPFGIIVIEF